MEERPTIEIEDFDVAAIVTLRGEHDLTSTAQLERTLEETGGRSRVFVDLSHCIFIDSTVIKALLRASQALETQGGQLSLVISGDRHQAVRRLCELMRIDRLMPTYETREAALRHLDTAASASSVPVTSLRALSGITNLSLTETDEQRRAV